MNAKLEIHYDDETDTLSVWNGQPVFSSYEVQQYLLIELDADRVPVGFTLEHALEMLQAHLPGDFTSNEAPEPGPTSVRQPDSVTKEFTQSILTDRKPRD